MPAAHRQIDIGGLEDPADVIAEIEAGYLWREQLWGAIRVFIAGYVDAVSGAKGYDACAAALDLRWGPKGRPISASVLNAALKDSERNNFRAEWLDWFARRCPEVAALLAHQIKPAKTDADRLADVEAELREHLSHKQAEQLLRRARAR